MGLGVGDTAYNLSEERLLIRVHNELREGFDKDPKLIAMGLPPYVILHVD